MKITTPRTIIITLLSISILGGSYLGYFSCGGFAWHRDLIYILIFTSSILGLLFPITALKRFGLRLIYPIVGVFLFVVFQSFTSALYPQSPESFSEFWKLFKIGINYGPC
ncbi:hypothetical protein OAA91_01940 [Fibrobacterales bacterium]|nr:hypothetical protein [Fibrobacterales bacterium]